ncbi:unnamed protein product, partial [Pylaiella littoralis]
QGRRRCRCCEKELRRAAKRLERVEGGLAAVATASMTAASRAVRSADAAERCRRRDRQTAEGEVGAVADAVRALAEREREREASSRQLEAVEQLVDSRVSTAVAKESSAFINAALVQRLSNFEREVRGILSEFSRKLAADQDAAAAALAAALAVVDRPSPEYQRQEVRKRCRDRGNRADRAAGGIAEKNFDESRVVGTAGTLPISVAAPAPGRTLRPSKRNAADGVETPPR